MTKHKLTLQDFRGQAFKFHINRGLAAFRADVCLQRDDTTFDFDVYLPTKGMNLQRDFVWTLFQKQQLIISIFKGLKLPPCTLIQKQNGSGLDSTVVYQVIDGKQRLSAIFGFLQNEFAIEWGGEQYFYNNLSDELQKEIRFYYVIADVGYEYNDAPISDEDKVRWFELINFAGTPQDAEHMNQLKNL